MSDYRQKAIDKLAREAKNGKFDRYGRAMKAEVKAALEEFSRQDEEFAQAIVQGGSLSDCMAAVSKKVKNGHISDIEAYSAAAAFYFPGSKVKFEMRIELCEHEHEEEPKNDLLIDLSKFL